MNLSRRTCITHLGVGLGATALGLPAWSQTAYPSRPVDIIVPAGAGGGTDVLARAFAEAARRHFPQPFTVVNRPGASGMIGHGEMINAKPDGYKLAMVFAEIVIVPHLGLTKLSYEDFTPIALLNADPAAVTVKADAPWKNLGEFIAEARKRPGDLKMGNSGAGSIWHLAAAALETNQGIKFNAVPFGGAAPAVLSLMGGHIDAGAVSPAEVAVHVQAGKLRTLAVMADKRVKGFENVPTAKEQGVNLSLATWRGLAAPKGTPPEIVAMLADVARKSIDEPVVKDTTDRLGMGLGYADGPAFAAMMKRDNETFKALGQQLGLKGA
ncbi:MAG TPA: tripartite tricarboxylate transporter substrate binding protein [Burkholderiaceae bacterium]|nr:tripartite tricarboxylate transporter substrate binding protein [Burkholderiaceae bacterium]